MKMRYLKPIPKKIVNKIQKLDLETHPEQNGKHRFYAYLTVWEGELIKITVAVKNYRKKWYCKQVAVHGVHSETCFVKDMEYVYFGMGFRVGWYNEGLQKGQRFYETKKWNEAYSYRYYDPYAPIVNENLIDKLPQYQYSEYKNCNMDVLRYLRIYEKYPQTEYFVKIGLQWYADSVLLLRKAAKDKSFRKWLIRNRQELSTDYYYVSTILRAYKTGETFTVAQQTENRLKTFRRDHDNRRIYKLFRGKLLERFFDYIDEKHISVHLYRDYLIACQYLGLDMTLNKNRFPHDFMLWHDRRIEEYRILKAADDARAEQERAERMARVEAERNEKDLARASQRNERYFGFIRIAEKYRSLQQAYSAFVIVLASEPADLVKEGIALHHCVGHMNYDEKFANEQSLIFFLRKADAPDEPFFTMEYSIRQKKILQCYGNHNIAPSEEIKSFLNNIWLPYANKTVQQIKTAA